MLLRSILPSPVKVRGPHMCQRDISMALDGLPKVVKTFIWNISVPTGKFGHDAGTFLEIEHIIGGVCEEFLTVE